MNELMKKLKALKAKQDAITANAEAEGRAVTDQELAQGETILAEMTGVISRIEQEQKSAQMTARIASFDEGNPKATPGLEVLPQPGTEKYGIGAMLIDVAQAARTHEKPHRLANYEKKTKAALGMNEAIPAEGGFLVDKDMASGFIENGIESSMIASRCFRIPISANSNGTKINGFDETSRATGSRWGGVRSYWIGEAATKHESQPKFRQVELNLKKQAVVIYATDEMLQDASVMESVVNRVVPLEIGFQTDDAIIRGDGAAKPLGILQSPCLVSVTKEGGQAADTILAKNVINMYSRIINPAQRANKIWITTQDAIPQLMTMTIPAGASAVPIWFPAGGAAGLPYDTLFGMPVVYAEQADKLGDQGDIILADMSGYALAEKGGIQYAASMHVQFLTDEMTFRWVYRVDGQPLLHSPITPFNGGATISSFVTLDERA